jgi:hypothetical protein
MYLMLMSIKKKEEKKRHFKKVQAVAPSWGEPVFIISIA